ncbi:MAG: 4Fe-4S dicluster domain-containing protein [Promethearchaeota archaeon]
MEIGKNYTVTPKSKFGVTESLLKTMLEKNMVDMVLAATSPKTIDALNPVSVEKPGDIVEDMHFDAFLAFDFAKNGSAAKFIHKNMNGALTSKVGAFARPCDVRALVELHKRRQVNLDNIILIGFEEHGRIDSKKLKKFWKAKDIDKAQLKAVTLTQEKISMTVGGTLMEFPYDDTIGISRNCRNCSSKAVVTADIKMNMLTDGVILTPLTKKGLDVVEQAGELLSFAPSSSDPSSLLHQIELKGRENQIKEIQEFRALTAKEKMEALGKCTMCGMCIRACPVCFCVDCILQKKRKAKDIDKFTYQLTRISHIADTCVQCGRCDSACPANLPLNIYFNDIAMKLEEKFNYVAGRSKDDLTPRSNISDLQIRFKR